MHRTWAIVEREMRRFSKSPMMIVMSMIFPLMQLVVLGYAFGGNVKHLKLAIVDQDHGVPAVKIRELASACRSGARTVGSARLLGLGRGHERPAQRRRQRRADDSAGLLAPHADQQRAARRADLGQHRYVRLGLLAATVGGFISHLNAPETPVRVAGAAGLDVVEVYPYVPYIQYLLPGSITMSIFMMVMIGGGIIFIDDKARGLHEGYLVTPITKLELVAGFNISGTIKAVLAGAAITVIGSIIAGVPSPLDPMRLASDDARHFDHGVRADQPDVPVDGASHRPADAADDVRPAEHGAVFPKWGGVPAAGLPGWMHAIAVVDPFTYSVHAFKSLLLKNTGFGAIAGDVTYLLVFSVVAMTAATALFKRTL